MATSEDSFMISPPGDGNSAPGGPGAVNPSALTVAQLARMLGVPEDTIRRHLASGAPASDGHINIVHYAAWLNMELVNDGD